MLVLIMVLCMTAFMTPAVFANEVTEGEGIMEITADKEHLNILINLRGTEVSYGEVIEKVYPEALKEIPKFVLNNMYNTPMNWSNSFNNQVIEEDTSDITRGWFYVNGFSQIGASGDNVRFKSYHTATNDYGALVEMPYMSVLSSLLYYDDTVVKSKFASGTDISSITTSNQYYQNAPSGEYLTEGFHYVDFPDGTIPSSGSDWSYSNFGNWWEFN